MMLQRVVRSTIIDAPIERVWAVLRDFNSHDQWHEAVEASRIEGGERSDQVGCVRSFTLRDGNRIREQLLTLSDSEHKSTYCIVEATVPLQRYVATVTLKTVTDGNRTFWHWESRFATPPGMERELRDMVAKGVYETGFENLRRYLRQGGDLRGSGSSEAMPAALPLPTRRVVVEHHGGPEVLHPQEGEAPAPRAGEVRIRQRAIGVNFIDIYLRRGWIPSALPLVPGMEAAGSVLDVGPQVSGLLPGDRVAYLGPAPGAYCGVRCVPADWVVRLPAAIEDETAAALLLKGITADYLLHDLGRVQRGTRLLVHAAAGGVGLLVCTWARRLGATVLGTVSSEEKARVARDHGCEHAIVTRDYRFADAVQRACGGADVLIDGLGDAARDENLAALARRGHWISLGQASGPLAPLPPDALVAKSLSFSRPVVFDYVASQAQLAERAQRVWDALADGSIRLPPIERHSLEAAAQAHARLESRATLGALVLLP
ncbi:SRPBCC family protein [Variovorax sp. RA8]|uniref:SRPBCC family protein n=1 Tax=Variovorax sp. (strain JCM 16519 / RA8) TaxID=662548 RepID=UPI0013196EB7|nr:SRPBCC family protein [Variovorax sp. RA8]VTU14947.1 Quinone oxidoreductase 1 [Variovorax sp. RA8]